MHSSAKPSRTALNYHRQLLPPKSAGGAISTAAGRHHCRMVTLIVANRLRRSSASTDGEFVIVVFPLRCSKLQFHLYRILATKLPSCRRSLRHRAAMSTAVHRSSRLGSAWCRLWVREDKSS